jgi:hypothetical protein
VTATAGGSEGSYVRAEVSQTQEEISSASSLPAVTAADKVQKWKLTEDLAKVVKPCCVMLNRGEISTSTSQFKKMVPMNHGFMGTKPVEECELDDLNNQQHVLEQKDERIRILEKQLSELQAKYDRYTGTAKSRTEELEVELKSLRTSSCLHQSQKSLEISYSL